MSNQDNSIEKTKEETITSVPYIRSSIVGFFLTLAFLTLIFGIFTILSVIIDTIQSNRLNYPDTVIIGILLIIGGSCLLEGTIIMKNWAPLPQIDTLDDTSDIKD